jgi:hypothetical protein
LIPLSIRAIIHLRFGEVKARMLTLEQIEAGILTLPSNDLQRLRQWFFDLDYQRWDDQLEQYIADGKLEALAEEALADFKAGHYR